MDKLIKYLPPHIMTKLKEYTYINEVRIKRNSRVVIKNDGKNHIIDVDTPSLVFDNIIDALIEHSYHSKLSELVEGYISIGDGYRVGIAGQAVTNNRTVTNLSEIDSVCIRIPRLIRGLCEPVMSYLTSKSYHSNLLIYSPPGVGKTTLLRDLTIRLCDTPCYKRVALIDSRKELYLKAMSRYPMLDVYIGYPKAKAIEMAVRTLAPDFLICDEIGSDEDTAAILSGQHTGVSIMATAHGGELSSLLRRPSIKALNESGVFDCYIGVKRGLNEKSYSFTFDEIN